MSLRKEARGFWRLSLVTKRMQTFRLSRQCPFGNAEEWECPWSSLEHAAPLFDSYRETLIKVKFEECANTIYIYCIHMIFYYREIFCISQSYFLILSECDNTLFSSALWLMTSAMFTNCNVAEIMKWSWKTKLIGQKYY